VAESVSKPLDYYANNVGGSLALIDVALSHGTKAFVLSSTCATYGIPERVPISEDNPRGRGVGPRPALGGAALLQRGRRGSRWRHR